MLLLIEPASFGFNTETSASNVFQNNIHHGNILHKAKEEFNVLVDLLHSKKIETLVIPDTDIPLKPDAVFPNNWFSVHGDIVVLYPMMAKNRRLERRMEIIDKLKPIKTIDLTAYENENKFLEGTGSLVLDRKNKIAYACLSQRTHIEVIDDFCNQLNYTPKIFHASTSKQEEIYHTNVLMAIGNKTVLICDEIIRDETEKQDIISILSSNHTLCKITEQQVFEFAGNMLLVESTDSKFYWIMSTLAFQSLTEKQKDILSIDGELIHSAIPTIEKIGGGSVRCMLAQL